MTVAIGCRRSSCAERSLVATIITCYDRAMTSEPTLPNPASLGTATELQAGHVALRTRTDVPFMAAIGAMVIGILLAVAAIVGTARSRR